MKVLLVDNGTHYKKRLEDLLGDFEITKVDFRDLSPKLHEERFDLIVLSGAYNTNSVKYYGDKVFAAEQEFINQAQVPVIGLCFAAQLIAHMHGAKLSFALPGGERIKGLKTIWNVKKTPFDFFGYHGGKVWASQRWRITELPDSLDCWSVSNEGVEVFRHRQKPIYGLQFHPERQAENNDGHRIFHSIIDLEFKRKS